jgi:CheY-like chemotaxis protein
MMGKTVLVVDDSPMIRRIVGQLLQECGYAVLLAENGRKGCEMAHEHRPDLVLMDVEMPLMDGIEATSHMKADPATSHIPVLIFTSLGSEEDIGRARRAGCSGFMNKPICRNELETTIRQILAGPEQ